MDDEDFKKWVLQRAKTLPVKEMMLDDYFIGRLTKDVIFGRSKSFNRRKKSATDEAGGLEFLYQEYQQSRKEN